MAPASDAMLPSLSEDFELLHCVDCGTMLFTAQRRACTACHRPLCVRKCFRTRTDRLCCACTAAEEDTVTYVPATQRILSYNAARRRWRIS